MPCHKGYFRSHYWQDLTAMGIMNTIYQNKSLFLSAEQEPPPWPSCVGGSNPQLTLSSSTNHPPCKSQIYIKKVSTTLNSCLTANITLLEISYIKIHNKINAKADKDHNTRYTGLLLVARYKLHYIDDNDETSVVYMLYGLTVIQSVA